MPIKPTKEQLAYIAGYIDGEGCIRIEKNNALRVEIDNTYPAVLFKIRDFFGGTVRLKSSSKGKWRSVWNYNACGLTAKTLLEALLPFLEEKLLQAELVVEFSDTCRKTKKERRDEIKALLKVLKRIDYFK